MSKEGCGKRFWRCKETLKQTETRVINILALIYRERNLFYHNGEAAIIGMTYVMRKWLHDEYREALIQVLLNFTCYQLNKELRVQIN